jgi:Tol biopolymer transport system component
MWFDRGGKATPVEGPKGHYTSPRISPDGKLVAIVIPDPDSGNRDIWISDLATGSRTRFTTNPANDWLPAWSPDGKYVAFATDRTPKSSIYRKAVDGSGTEESLVPPSESGGAFAPDWSRDGRFLIYQLDTRTGVDLWMLPLADRKPIPFLATPFVEMGPRFSPSSKWVAYTSRESGAFEVYVAPVDRPGKQRVSANGGFQPAWRGDGKELFFVSGNMLLSAEATASGDALSFAAPKTLFQVCLFTNSGSGTADYDVTADGKRFLFPCQSPDDKKPSITVAIQWLDMVKYPGQKGTRQP